LETDNQSEEDKGLEDEFEEHLIKDLKEEQKSSEDEDQWE
jgi:hypothetical protein